MRARRCLLGFVAVLLLVAAPLGCGRSHRIHVGKAVLEDNSSFGNVFVEFRGPTPVVRLLSTEFRRVGPDRLTVVATAHGQKRCTRIVNIGNAAPGGLSDYGGQQAAVIVFGSQSYAQTICSAFR